MMYREKDIPEIADKIGRALAHGVIAARSDGAPEEAIQKVVADIGKDIERIYRPLFTDEQLARLGALAIERSAEIILDAAGRIAPGSGSIH